MKEKNSYYITTPIYYPSDNLHIGHAYTTVAADCIARFKRMQGFDVFYLTGTDEHGQKVEKAAREKNMEPLEYVDGIVADIQSLWQTMMITNSDFIRTTEPRHEKIVQKIFQKVYDQGDIYLSDYEGWYCTPCETFFRERQLIDNKCPDCGREVELLKEQSYFFKLSNYAERLLEHIENHPEFIQPESRRHEIVNFIKGGLDDLSVSRTTFKWGIPVPFNSQHVIYVWFDALINYLSAIGYGNDSNTFERYWPADVHFMAKDIVRFHAIIWPIILMALDLPLPKQVFAHGWIMLEGAKMSKSKGNVIDPRVLIEKYGVDAVRYYLIKELSFGQDGFYSEDLLISRINSDLANDLGNLVSRTAGMIIRYFAGQIPDAGLREDSSPLEITAKEVFEEATNKLERFDFSGYVSQVLRLISRANKYIDETEPWILAKDDQNKSLLASVLYDLSETIRIVVTLLHPVMPNLAGQVNQQMQLFDRQVDELRWQDAGIWGLCRSGGRVVKGPAIFPRIEVKKDRLEQKNTEKAELGQAEKPADLISIDDFSKIDLRVAEVVACEKMKKADKLLVLTLKLDNETRTVVSGIAKNYDSEQLIGKKVVLVANLEPIKLRGVNSAGMILAASHGDELEVLTVTKDLPPGSKVK